MAASRAAATGVAPAFLAGLARWVNGQVIFANGGLA
jgi:hypothetical protein